MHILDVTDFLIAIVDDEPSVRTALSNLLLSVSYETVLFESAEAVLKSDVLDDINFMVLDVKLKGMSGIELFEHLRYTGVIIPTVFISGNADLETQSRIKQAGAILFLPKPVDVELLLNTIDGILKT